MKDNILLHIFIKSHTFYLLLEEREFVLNKILRYSLVLDNDKRYTSSIHHIETSSNIRSQRVTYLSTQSDRRINFDKLGS